jgi:putative transposase
MPRQNPGQAAAQTLMKKALKRHGSHNTDGQRSYKAAMKELGNTEK